MRLAHQFAMESESVTADMVEVSEFPHLGHRYDVMGVPRTLANERLAVDGMLPERPFLEAVLATLAA